MAEFRVLRQDAGTTDGSNLVSLIRENGLTLIENNIFFGNDAVDLVD